MRFLLALILVFAAPSVASAFPNGCALLIRGRVSDTFYLAEIESGGGWAWLALPDAARLESGQRVYGQSTAILDDDLPVFEAQGTHV